MISFAALSPCHRSRRALRRLETLAGRPQQARSGPVLGRSHLGVKRTRERDAVSCLVPVDAGRTRVLFRDKRVAADRGARPCSCGSRVRHDRHSVGSPSVGSCEKVAQGGRSRCVWLSSGLADNGWGRSKAASALSLGERRERWLFSSRPWPRSGFGAAVRGARGDRQDERGGRGRARAPRSSMVVPHARGTRLEHD